MNPSLLLANIIGGIFVLSSYFIYLPKMSSQQLWVGIPKSLQTFFLISILLAIISFISAFFLLSHLSSIFWFGLSLFYIGASLWSIMLYHHSKLGVFIALSLTSLGALLMTFHHNRLITLLFTYLFLHCLIMDNIIWFSYFLNSQ